jgi:signal transduction histidine kinase/DNA-binding response OmpR family regulator
MLATKREKIPHSISGGVVMIFLNVAALAAAAFSASLIAAIGLIVSIGLIRDAARLNQRLASLTLERDQMAGELQSLGKTQERAEAASEAKSRFLATVSHEIRTPLNGVLGMADLMLDTRLNPEQANYAQAIKTSGEALLTLIEEILDFSRIEAGKLDIVEDAVELTSLIESVVELLAPRAQGKGIEIASFIAPDLPEFIQSDAMRLRQIVTNLAGNAVKFTENGGVGVYVTRAGTDLSIAIKDTGPGIPAARLGAIFEEFEQVDGGHNRKHGGTGLGLAISRRLARLMGGDVSATSRFGAGSTFTLRLPVLVEHVPIAQADTPKTCPHSVLIVTEGPFEGQFLGDYLGASGSQIRLARSAEEALAHIAQRAPDLLMMDAAFGQQNAGIVVAAALKAGCQRRLVLLSPYERRSFGSPAGAGFDGYLVKPVRRRSLSAQLEQANAPIGLSAALGDETALRPDPLAGCRVLIAEDNDINALLAGRLIERLGGRSVRASNGREALNLLETTLVEGAQPFDILLCDVRMPELDGLSALRQWRSMEAQAGRPPLPAIALTANAFREDQDACYAAGFEGFLSKPLDREAFLRLLDRVLGKRHAAA